MQRAARLLCVLGLTAAASANQGAQNQPATALILGQVVDAQGSPVAGAIVTFGARVLRCAVKTSTRSEDKREEVKR